MTIRINSASGPPRRIRKLKRKPKTPSSFAATNGFDFRFYGLPFPKNAWERKGTRRLHDGIPRSLSAPVPRQRRRSRENRQISTATRKSIPAVFTHAVSRSSLVWLHVVDPFWMNVVQTGFVAAAVCFVLGLGTRVTLRDRLVRQPLLHPSQSGHALRRRHDDDRVAPLPDDRPQRRGLVGRPRDLALVEPDSGISGSSPAEVGHAARLRQYRYPDDANPPVHHLLHLRHLEVAGRDLVERHRRLERARQLRIRAHALGDLQRRAPLHGPKPTRCSSRASPAPAFPRWRSKSPIRS